VANQDPESRIAAFLKGSPHAVVGASRDRSKYGNKVLRAFIQNNRPVYAVNPAGGKIEGLESLADLASIAEPVHGISIITPPQVTERIIDEAGELGIRHVWMQPGAESADAIARARELGMSVIAEGPCILVVLGFSER
jgi:predicted CoA-binding protein